MSKINEEECKKLDSNSDSGEPKKQEGMPDESFMQFLEDVVNHGKLEESARNFGKFYDSYNSNNLWFD